MRPVLLRQGEPGTPQYVRWGDLSVRDMRRRRGGDVIFESARFSKTSETPPMGGGGLRNSKNSLALKLFKMVYPSRPSNCELPLIGVPPPGLPTQLVNVSALMEDS